jgi:hypothetical protein
MIDIPESQETNKGRLGVSGQQRALFKALRDRSEGIAQMYLGALYALDQTSNPDRLALAAHGIRELLEKLPMTVGITPRRPDIVGKCQQLAVKWKSHALKSNTHNNGRFSGEIDVRLHRFLAVAKGFFDWFEARPNRRDERTEMIRQLDAMQVAMPSAIEKIRTDELAHYVDYFNAISHHNGSTTDEEFKVNLGQLEAFLLNYFYPRTFDEFAELDELMNAGRANAK